MTSARLVMGTRSVTPGRSTEGLVRGTIGKTLGSAFEGDLPMLNLGFRGPDVRKLRVYTDEYKTGEWIWVKAD